MRLIYLITADKELSLQLREEGKGRGLFIRTYSSLEECFLEPYQPEPSLLVVDSETVDLGEETAGSMLQAFHRKVPLVILAAESGPEAVRNGFSFLPRETAHLELLDRLRTIGVV